MKLKFLPMAAALVLAQPTFAASYSDSNPAEVWLNFLNPSYTGTFDIFGEGYNPATEQITSATATFTLFDLLLQESWTITLGDGLFQSGGSFSGTINLGGGVSAAALLDLNADGVLSYTVTRTSGEFWLTNALLVAETTNRTPDGGQSVVLLGAGLLALGTCRRLRKRAA